MSKCYKINGHKICSNADFDKFIEAFNSKLRKEWGSPLSNEMVEFFRERAGLKRESSSPIPDELKRAWNERVKKARELGYDVKDDMTRQELERVWKKREEKAGEMNLK